MSGAPVLRVEGLGKKFTHGLRGTLRHGVQDIARELTWWRRRPAPFRSGEFWALRDVSFDLRPGESLGVIGGNGAGKSTLLRVMCGLLKPDAGRVRTRGRVRAIIELGAAFNPVLTGRENIHAQAALHGYSRRELARHLDAIIDFAEIGEFIDSPVQHYSSGMRARLGFAIAVHLGPEVLLVDEVLAVGDIAFQNKCLEFMRGYLAQGGALVFVGHASHQVQAACERGLVLSHGEVAFQGGVVDALDFYFRQQRVSPDDAGVGAHGANGSRPSTGPIALPARSPGSDDAVGIDAVAVTAAEADEIANGSAMRVAVRYTARRAHPDVSLVFTFFARDGRTCVGGGYPPEPVTLCPGTHALSCVIPRLPLHGGDYFLRVTLFDWRTGYPLALSGWEDSPHRFTVRSDATNIANLRAMIGMHVGVEAAWESR
jgi:ABC-type polysaccharide/polyol phosphate transport system ATPase subunit